ncbi:hypothetical protein [Fibrobacter sp. UWEL]|uniref:hypothetical protein n=1 Tax=Fibrobacter sp. UWEL TaxID=1896209 RepID=UPI00091430B7|nr:hypothetical protein [Fibrobacter sp. UWEL]SHK81235.1 hypothetical protein SAMN05720468_10767 [Fibrobacter sp. UWEL]
MTLLITAIAAIISSLLWYNSMTKQGKDTMKYSTLCYMFWGASLMWFVDAIAEYAELGAEYFTPAAADMLNDAFLGVSVVALALILWLARLLWSARDLCRAHSA